MSNVSGIANLLALRRELPKICNRIFHAIGSQQREATYQNCLAMDLLEAGVQQVHTEVNLPLTYKGHVVGTRRADMILELSSGERAILELKTFEGKMLPRHRGQLEYYMHHAKINDGYLVNFPHDEFCPSITEDKCHFEYESLMGSRYNTRHLLHKTSQLELRNAPGQREVEVINIRRNDFKGVKKEPECSARVFSHPLEDDRSDVKHFDDFHDKWWP